MEYSNLLKSGKPCFYLAAINMKEFDFLSSRLISQHKNAVIRTIRGKKSRTVSDFFDEVAATLQFPVYFGENWNAFNDCINDLDWLVGEAYILLVNDAPALLDRADEEDFRILIKMLSIANEEWTEPNKYGERGRSATSFHVVLQCPISETSTFSDRLQWVGAEFDRL